MLFVTDQTRAASCDECHGNSPDLQKASYSCFLELSCCASIFLQNVQTSNETRRLCPEQCFSSHSEVRVGFSFTNFFFKTVDKVFFVCFVFFPQYGRDLGGWVAPTGSTNIQDILKMLE